MNILILRPEPGATRTARRVEQAGMTAIIAPLFSIEPMAWDAGDAAQYDCLLLSSANAIIHAGQGLRDYARLPIYAVGPATAKAAREAGLTVIATGNEGAQAMTGHMYENGHSRPLWLTGRDHSGIMPGNGINLSIRAVYSAEKLPPSSALIEAMKRPHIAMLHSARAARHYAELVDEKGVQRSQIIIATLSEKIADAAGKGWKDMIIPDQIDDALLISTMATCFTNRHPAP